MVPAWHFHSRAPAASVLSLQVMSAAFAPDGSKAVTASKDGTLRIWNLAVRYQLQVNLTPSSASLARMAAWL
jgi:WD40 repeat protein